MKDTTEKIRAFHNELQAIAATGIPLAICSTEGPQTLRSQLLELEHHLFTELDRGKSIDEALATASALTPEHRIALLLWIHGDNRAMAMESLSALSTSRIRRGKAGTRHLVLPFIWAALAYFAFVYICTFMVPTSEALASRIFMEPGPALSALLVLRSWMPVWMTAVPLITIWVFIRRSFLRLSKTSHSKSDYCDMPLRHAALAEHAADLLDVNTPEPQVQNSVESAAQKLSSSSRPQSKTSLPPLLGWAFNQTTPDRSTSTKLRFAARIYKGTSRLVAEFPLWSFRQKAAMAFGGVLVLALGLSVFLPVIEILYFIATDKRA